jgi:competence protein ComFC
MKSVADFAYPEMCLGCGVLVRGGVCNRCLGKASFGFPEICDRCGAGCKTAVAECLECRGRGFHFDRARQSFEFESVARLAVLSLKYRGHLALAETIAIHVAHATAHLEPKAITWVPTSELRIRQRGFDHARLLAEEVARRLDVPCSQLIARTRETPPQVGLEPEVRRKNLAGTFECTLAPDSVVVVDDVFTTGASASEAARALKQAGAMRVDSVAFARTVPPAKRSHSSRDGDRLL